MNELKHYGVLGMKWGRRKGSTARGGSSTKIKPISRKKALEGYSFSKRAEEGKTGTVRTAVSAATALYMGARIASTIPTNSKASRAGRAAVRALSTAGLFYVSARQLDKNKVVKDARFDQMWDAAKKEKRSSKT